MTELVIQYVEWGVAHAHIWGFALIFILMAIESSLIPFPSEVIMIPGGFLAYRGDLTFGDPLMDVVTVFVCGLTGAVAGAEPIVRGAIVQELLVTARYGWELTRQALRAEGVDPDEYGPLSFVGTLQPVTRTRLTRRSACAGPRSATSSRG